MPKKKTIPPPDDFSSEFMETESAKELSEQQVEAAVSDNTETPLAEPPEVDLGSGDVSGTAEVEENEPDAENTADAAEIVPVSDEKAEDPEYDSILQELNSSTPAPLDSSGENDLDALLLEENVENAPPAEDETESADGETAPQPTAPPAPAGRRDSYILTVDAKDRIETEEERREVIWHEIKTSHIAGRILTGTLDGVEQTPSGRTIVVVDYKGYRIAIPLKEMMLYSGPVPYGAKYKPFMERMNSILATMLTAEIDFIVRGLDNTARSVVASRKAAMLRKRQTFYLDANEDGIPMIYEGRVVQARVIGVAEKVLRVEVFGVECTIFARDLSAAWFGDAREYYSVGDRVLVRVLTIDRDDINHISITADIRSVSSTANQSNLDIVARTNALRAEHGIAALTADDQLMRAAQVRADEMAATGAYSHTRPDGRKYYTVTDCRQVGENIHQIPLLYLAQQKTALAETLVYSWSKSAGHMENMTDESYAAIGVGLARGTDANGLECWYCVQLFLRSGYSISAVDKPATK